MPVNEQDGAALREMFSEMPHEVLVDVAVELSKDAARLRRELDEAQGIIR